MTKVALAISQGTLVGILYVWIAKALGFEGAALCGYSVGKIEMDRKPINREIRDEWIKALRSGKYHQTEYALQDGGAYCCLGVLCDAVLKRRKDFKDIVGTNIHGNILTYEKDGETNKSELSAQVRKKIGMTKQTMMHLTMMNDACDNTFEEIADWIEKKI